VDGGGDGLVAGGNENAAVDGGGDGLVAGGNEKGAKMNHSWLF
jgi:hypothetical protein